MRCTSAHRQAGVIDSALDNPKLVVGKRKAAKEPAAKGNERAEIHTSSDETLISLAFSSASCFMNLTIWSICLSTCHKEQLA